MSLILGNGGQGKQLARTTPIQVTGLKAVGQDGGVLLTCDPATEASAPYLKDLWVVWKKKADGPIQNPYDGQHMTFAAQTGPVGQDLAKLAPGSTLKIVENNVATRFYVDKHDYESALNGNGFSLLTRVDCYDKRAWDAGNVNTYADSDLDAFLNGDYKMLLEEKVRNAIVPTKFYYTPGNMNNTVTTLERDVFELSATELGMSQAYVNVEGSVLPIAETLKIAYLNKTASTQWTRSPSTNLSSHAWFLTAGGTLDNAGGTANSCGSRPSFCLPGNTKVSLEPDSQGDYTLV